ncbi:MAG TPA: hypothetical protein VGM29_19425 [Polyangiaceae bacterium]
MENEAVDDTGQATPVVSAPPPLESAPLEFLLAEAKDRYKSEHDKFGQTYARAGIYLGVLAVFVNLLVRFLDKPPPNCDSWVEIAFRWSIILLLVAIVSAAACIVGAILGRPVGYVPEPSSWAVFIDGELRPFLSAQGQNSTDGVELAEELRRQTLTRYSKAIDHNVGVNRKVAGWLHFSSYCIFAGLLLGVFGTALYAWLTFSIPAGENARKVRVIDHVEVAPYNHE